MSDVLNQIKQKIETTVKSGIETVEHLVGIGKTTAAKAVTAAEPAIAQAEAAVSQATTQVEASAAATLATTGATGRFRAWPFRPLRRPARVRRLRRPPMPPRPPGPRRTSAYNSRRLTAGHQLSSWQCGFDSRRLYWRKP